MNNEQRMIETSEIEFVNSEWVQKHLPNTGVATSNQNLEN
jgi:hypothetical protein